MRIQRFTANEFAEYQRWFGESLIRRHLGAVVDQAWLDFVLTDEAGLQLAGLELDDEQRPVLVSVVAVILPTPHNLFAVISDLAVKPQWWGRGIGKRTLAAVPSEVQLGKQQQWRAFVDQQNRAAFAFFHAFN